MKIYTKTGDAGITGLLGGVRASKSDSRVWAYGVIDEVNSSLGFARSIIKDGKIRDIIYGIQQKLFEIGAELASLGTTVYRERIHGDDVLDLEKIIDNLEAQKPEQKAFIIPGDTVESAALDVARTRIREAERFIIILEDNFAVNKELLRYINRLSDLIYVAARYIDYIHVKEEAEAAARLVLKKKLDRELCEYLVKKCVDKSCEVGIPMVICITDECGNIIILERMDGALLASIDIAKNKAYTAAALKIPTHELREPAGPGGQLYGINNIDRIITFGGGFPLSIGNRIVGAIGVSGGTVEQDMVVSSFGLKAFEEVFNCGTGRG